jgi:plastocyanin domain-containing protein
VYHPDRVVVTEGQSVRITFVRKEYTGCTLEVVFPTLGIRRTLPPNEPVTIDLGTPAAGEIPFHCGMDMSHGVVVVAAKE